jgi:hypothetical protein
MIDGMEVVRPCGLRGRDATCSRATKLTVNFF